MYDSNLELKDAGLVASSAYGTVDGSTATIDLGNALAEMKMVIDISAIEIASNNELYKIALVGSRSSDITSGVTKLVEVEFGASEVVFGDFDSTVGQYVVPVLNVWRGLIYRYVRAYCTVSGSVATGINYSAWLVDEMSTGWWSAS